MRPSVVTLGVLLAASIAVAAAAVWRLRSTERFLRDSTPGALERFADLSDPASVPCAEAEFLDSSNRDTECLSRIFAGVTAGVLIP